MYKVRSTLMCVNIDAYKVRSFTALGREIHFNSKGSMPPDFGRKVRSRLIVKTLA